MSTVKLSSRSQIILPSAIRKALGIHPGDRLIVEAHGDHAVVRKAPASDVEGLESHASDAWTGYAEELQKARDQWD